MKSIDLPDVSELQNKRLSILLLCDDDKSHASTILDHISAFSEFSKHDVYIFNPRNLRGSLFLSLSEFDVVIIHYSLVIILDQYLAPNFRKKLRHFK